MAKWTLKGFLMSSCNVITEYEIMFCFLTLDLEWKIIYVGSAESEEYDQVLDSVLVGPVPAGRHMFVFQVRYSWSLCTPNMLLDRLSHMVLIPFLWVKSLLLLHSLFICFCHVLRSLCVTEEGHLLTLCAETC